jgi:hypothetical protein
VIQLYPNPVTDNLHVSVDEKFRGNEVKISAYTLLGKVIFDKTFRVTETALEIPVLNTKEKLILVSIEGAGLSHRQLVMIN